MTNSHDTSTPAMSAETVPNDWNRADRLLYTLAEQGYHRGKPVLVNALMVNVTFDQRYATAEQADAVTDRIFQALSASHLAKEGGDAVRSMIVAIRDKHGNANGTAYEQGVWDQSQRILSKLTALSTPTEGPASQTEGMGGDASQVRMKALGSIAWMLFHHSRKELQATVLRYAEKHGLEAVLRKGGSELSAALTPPESAEAVPVADAKESRP